MVILTFEGTDNLGKSTLISKIADRYKNDYDITFMHATSPKCNDGEDPGDVQELTFMQTVSKCNYIANTEHILARTRKNIVFQDRAEFGEYCYGQLYRNQTPKRILQTFKKLKYGLGTDRVVIYLEASPEFVVSHDDHKSFTSDYDEEKKLAGVKRELELFNECFNVAKPHKFIRINVEGPNNSYRNVDELCDEIISKVKEMNVEL